MAIKSETIFKEQYKALGDIFLSECKSLHCSIEAVEAILESGAPIDFKNSSAIKLAAKNLNFKLIKLLIDKGATLSDLAIMYITSMCDNKGFEDELEGSYFELIDLIKNKTNLSIELLVPYINNLAVNGRLDKLYSLMARYSLSEAEIAGNIYVRIIFEIVNNGYEKMLRFIEQNRNWVDTQTIDLCVSCDEWMVLEYILQKHKLFPSTKAVAQSVYLGHIMTLNVLLNSGYDFIDKPLLVSKAKQAAKLGKRAGYDFLCQIGIK